MIATNRQRFLVLGSGSWGTALAIYLARLNHDVVLWGHDIHEIQKLSQDRANTHYLPGFPFPENLNLSADLAQAFQKAGENAIVFIMVPSHAFQEVLLKIQPFINTKTIILWGTKGLSEHGELLHEVCLKHFSQNPIAVLSGPSFALEVAKGLPTAVTIATNQSAIGQQLVSAFHSDVFRVYLSQDIIGVQLGGVVKNVLAIATGMSDGLGFGANARAGLITRGVAELCRLGDKLGAKLPTLIGLSGIGDMVLTCTDNQSRNRRFGLALGQGKAIDEAEKAIGQVVEGKMNAKQMVGLANKHQVDMPICQQVYAVLYENVSPKQAVTNLLTRSPKEEV
jgi:glycerol-3-phosphate dehydrogenase (NAD(P)+)